MGKTRRAGFSKKRRRGGRKTMKRRGGMCKKGYSHPKKRRRSNKKTTKRGGGQNCYLDNMDGSLEALLGVGCW